MPSSTVEDYLKSIFKLSGEDGKLAPIGKVATQLGVTPGTATTMMKQLERQGFADYSPRKGVVLSAAGHRAVMRVLRRHRLLELFLVEVMGFDWSAVHEEADVLEHAASDRLIDRIDAMLGLPPRDPHGDPIPDAHGVMRGDDSICLEEFTAGHFQLARVTRTASEFLSWLGAAGLHPGTKFELIGHDSLADLFRIHVESQAEELHFGQKVAEHLWVFPPDKREKGESSR